MKINFLTLSPITLVDFFHLFSFDLTIGWPLVLYFVLLHSNVSIYIVAEMIKPCMSNFGENVFFFFFFFLYWQSFVCQFVKNSYSWNLHDLTELLLWQQYMFFLCSPDLLNVSTFLRYKVWSFQQRHALSNKCWLSGLGILSCPVLSYFWILLVWMSLSEGCVRCVKL